MWRAWSKNERAPSPWVEIQDPWPKIDRKVSTKELARQAGCKQISPCKPETANRHTGFLVGGTSPFGTRKTMPVYMESSILDLPLIYINGGRRGFLVGLHPHDIVSILKPKLVNCALPG